MKREIDRRNLKEHESETWESLAFFRGLVNSSIWGLNLIGLLLFFAGCAPIQPLPPPVSIAMPVRVHITMDRSTWPESMRRSDVRGCADARSGQIWILREAFYNPLGAQETLGHELEHLLRGSDPRMPDPHGGK